jgi:hypothetical protein
MIAQTKKEDLIVISNEKQKDDEEFKPIALRLKTDRARDRHTDRQGDQVMSCVARHGPESDQGPIVDAPDPCRLKRIRARGTRGLGWTWDGHFRRMARREFPRSKPKRSPTRHFKTGGVDWSKRSWSSQRSQEATVIR